MALRYPEISVSPRRSPSGRSLWCGPFALSILTGIPYDEVHERAVRIQQRWLNKQAKARGLKPGYWRKTHFKGMHERELARIAERLGVRVNWTYVRRAPLTLLTFTREHTARDKAYLLVAGNHFVIVRNRVLYHSHHDPLPVEEVPRYRLAKVTAWAEVRPRPNAITTELS